MIKILSKTVIILFVLMPVLTLFSCKGDKNTVVVKHGKDSQVLYYDNGIKDSIASVNFNFGLDALQEDEKLKAESYFKLSNNLEPNNVVILNALGNISYELKKKDKAISYYERAIKIDSTFPHSYINYGWLHNAEKDHEKAISLYKKGLGMENNQQRKGVFYYNIANALYKLGRYSESQKYNNKALLIVKNKLLRNDIRELKEVLDDEL